MLQANPNYGRPLRACSTHGRALHPAMSAVARAAISALATRLSNHSNPFWNKESLLHMPGVLALVI